MKLEKKISIFILLILSVFILSSINVFSWNSHFFYTELAIKNNDWINNFPEIEITPYTYEDIDQDKYNPKFVIKYVEGEIGRKTNASDILINYSDEPDWDLDTNLELNKLQALTGGSQGYRHMYFSVFAGLLKAGDAPKRASHFFEMSKIAFGKGDNYWGFRFAARAVHYLEDLSQPYHAYPVPLRVLFKKFFNIKKITILATNAHYGYEDFNGYLFKHQKDEFYNLLSEVKTIKMDDVEDSTIKLSKEARKDFTPSYRETMKLFPVLDNNQELLILEEQEIIKVANSPDSQGLVNLMKKDILLGLGYLNGFFDLLKESVE
ncbi:hypothetical protein A2V47_02385 [Candidatus Atribacteria bacterium RBG_19FT_COMBO_35_14]|uniref:Phospholipase n=1 Tax=Candidatus Sediminicultor quintus TaxID=1797291 RepID=A0A1F5A8Y1_9BACT|nr:MAG: hypothetical protein A2V47_02385 [Candidatus Atribacteria bacterium RBG_19FT_COMBO_35_14]OGD35073.1 MAG: hypothetical protein A2V94_03030 [Candidatus Atribacteria bacterium RBG_16_35_8]